MYHSAALVSFNSKDYFKMRKVNIEGTLNGVVVEAPEVQFHDIGGIIKAEVLNSADNTKNLDFIIDGMRYTLDTTTGAGPSGGALVSLANGANATTLFENYIYVWLNGGTPILKASTMATSDIHAPIGFASLFSYARTVADGSVDTWRRFNDAPDNGEDKGQTRRTNDAIRNKLGTTYFSGIAGTTTVLDASVKIATTSGEALQLNFGAITAQDGNSYTIFNDATNTATYESVTDLASIIETIATASLIMFLSCSKLIFPSLSTVKIITSAPKEINEFVASITHLCSVEAIIIFFLL